MKKKDVMDFKHEFVNGYVESSRKAMFVISLALAMRCAIAVAPVGSVLKTTLYSRVGMLVDKACR